jgi:hypothetical protein
MEADEPNDEPTPDSGDHAVITVTQDNGDARVIETVEDSSEQTLSLHVEEPTRTRPVTADDAQQISGSIDSGWDD